MLDPSIILRSAQYQSPDIPGIIRSGIDTYNAIQEIPLDRRRSELDVQAREQAAQQQQAQAAQQQQMAEQQKMIQKASLLNRYASQLKSIPMAQRRTYLNSLPSDVVNAIGFTPDDLAKMPIDDASIDSVIMQTRPIVEQFSQQQQNRTPAELETFNALTKGLSKEDVEQAKRVRLGLESKSKGVRQIDIGGVPYVVDLDAGTAAPVQVGGQSVTSESVGESEGKIAGAKTKAIESAKDVQAFIADAVPKIASIESNIQNYDSVIQAIDAGARTGTIWSKLPAINEASKTLKNMQIQLGLDVVAMGKFGALSEGELKVALSSSLPDNKEPEALRQWVIDKQSAQRKAAQAMRDAVEFLNNGGSIADLASFGNGKRQSQQQGDSEYEGFEIID